MKRLLLWTLALSLPLTQIVRADTARDRKRHKHEVEQARSEEASSQAAQRNVVPARRPEAGGEDPPGEPAQQIVAPPGRPVAGAPSSVAPLNRARASEEPRLTGRSRS